MKFTVDDFQRVLDSYSVGKIEAVFPCGEFNLTDKIVIQRVLTSTNQGLYMILFAHHDVIHETWWSSKQDELVKRFMIGCGLKHAKNLTVHGESYNADHKLNSYFFVFSL